MKNIITDPFQTEKKMEQSGFVIRPVGMAFEVSLTNRKVQRSEVAFVLGCEADDLRVTEHGVLVQ